ncbi:hypothetical protein OROMI_031400 [Orobanche minor]
MNSGVCVKGVSYDDYESDYYGRLIEVVRLEYPGLPLKQVVLFNCEWFDPTSTGTKVDPYYKLLEINHKRRFNRYEPFILATQATQVYYCTYPSLKRDKVDWWAVCKVKARSTGQFIEESISASFQEETIDTPAFVHVDIDQISLNDVNNELAKLEDELNSSDEMHETSEDEFDTNEETDDESDDVGIGDMKMIAQMTRGKGTRGLRQNQGRHQGRNQGSGIRPSEPEPPSTPQDDNDVDDFTNDTPSSSRETPTPSSAASASKVQESGVFLVVSVVGPRRLMPQETSSEITKIFKQSMSSKGQTGKKVPEDFKEQYFNEKYLHGHRSRRSLLRRL